MERCLAGGGEKKNYSFFSISIGVTQRFEKKTVVFATFWRPPPPPYGSDRPKNGIIISAVSRGAYIASFVHLQQFKHIAKHQKPRF